MSTKQRTSSGEGSRGHDYEAADTLVVAEPEQLRALADELRTHIVSLLRERALSTQQLSKRLGIPKGTVGHHLKVLERAGLIRVVRTRKVRALTEKFYGRTARLFLFQAEDPADARAVASATLRHAAAELERTADGDCFGHPKSRLSEKDAARFGRRLQKLMDDFVAADSPDGVTHALVGALYRHPDA